MPAAAIDLAAFLDPAQVALMSGRPARDEVLSLLVGLIGQDWGAIHRAAFATALAERELLTSTAIGNGLAVPHARVDHLDRCRVALAVIPAGVAWDARDGQDVRIAVCIAAREQQRTEHLQLLAAVATRLGDADRRARMTGAASAQAVIDALR